MTLSLPREGRCARCGKSSLLAPASLVCDTCAGNARRGIAAEAKAARCPRCGRFLRADAGGACSVCDLSTEDAAEAAAREEMES